jgi:hypothetical protein
MIGMGWRGSTLILGDFSNELLDLSSSSMNFHFHTKHIIRQIGPFWDFRFFTGKHSMVFNLLPLKKSTQIVNSNFFGGAFKR